MDMSTCINHHFCSFAAKLLVPDLARLGHQVGLFQGGESLLGLTIHEDSMGVTLWQNKIAMENHHF
jgi:hypothetical protein